jgi:hypothetical protein
MTMADPQKTETPKLTKVLVKVPPSQAGFANYYRAGIAFQRGAEKTLEVTAEQLKLLKGDPQVLVVELR